MGPYPDDGEQLEPLVTDVPKEPAWYKSRRWKIWLTVVVALLLATGLIGGTDEGRASLRSAQAHASGIFHGPDSPSASSTPLTADRLSSQRVHHQLKHLLIPASSPSPHLCKLLLTASTLSYPHPHLLAWQETFEKLGMMSGGSHIAKITRSLEYLETLAPEHDDELVLMIDGYDVWFQLPAEVLVRRYYDILSDTDMRLEQRYGQKGWSMAFDKRLHDGLSSRIVFAAGKRCAPNQVHTIACYALPESPLPMDLYGQDTDTPIGHNQYYSGRQRYLNSGIIMGPVRDMRKLFERANVSTTREELWLKGDIAPGDPSDNGSGGSDYFYHGSDQSIFAKIWGRQEYVFEVLRRRLNPDWESEQDTYKSSSIESTRVNDILNPDFPHEHWNDEHFQIRDETSVQEIDHPDPWTTDPQELLRTYAFGITMDYFSDLGHQTANSELDATWLTHGGQQPLSAQIEQHRPRRAFDCRDPWASNSAISISTNKPNALADVVDSYHPSNVTRNENNQNIPNPWLETPLYTHICLARIPVMIHHNGDKGARERDWNRMSWLYDVARPLLSTSDMERDDAASEATYGGACTDKGNCVSWNEMCPKEMLDEGQIFGPDKV